MASAIRLSPNQLPKLYNRLPPICKKLGIEQPEFYLSMDPNPNAWTFGDTKIFITITSGLVDMMTEEELDAVIAHECGHILCHHVLYQLSCDRAASIVTTPAIVASTMARLSGGPSSITKNIDLVEWAKQADQYEAIRNDGLWNKTLQVAAIMNQNHPFSAVRVKEILKWGKSSQYKTIVDHLSTEKSGKICLNCKQPIADGWTYCKHCGNKL